MIKVDYYYNDRKGQWDDFILNSKNGSFLFYRDYMEYHSDRYEDHSLMFYENDNLIALLPANLNDNILYSHEGLTYGGIISSVKMKTPKMLAVFDCLIDYLQKKQIDKLIYKTVPYIFHKHFSDEDLYALFRNNAKLIRRDVSSAIIQDNKLPFERGRKRQIKKALGSKLDIQESTDYKGFFEIVQKLLHKKYNVNPVHNYKEMVSLANKFPHNIKLFGCYKDNKMISGAIIYVTDRVAHAQYIFSSEEGKLLGANDIMNDFLINKKYTDKFCFNFGISTTNAGQNLNSDLIAQKEMFGARAVCFDFYEINLKSH